MAGTVPVRGKVNALAGPRDPVSRADDNGRMPAADLEDGDVGRRAYVQAGGAVLLTFIALGVLILARYRLHHYSYPVGWDSPYYAWRAGAVTVDGLERIGTIRAGSPLFVGLMMQVTGQNAFTMVPVAMAVLAGIVALGNAAMARAALAIPAVWIPVIGVVSWVAFGHIGMIGGHLDNVLNAAFVTSGFAAAVAFAGYGRGAVAAALLFMASALAEWPFYLLAMAVFVLALGLFAWPALRSPARRQDLLAPVGRLLLAVVASATFTGLTFLSRPPDGSLGLRAFGAQFRATVRERFFQRLRDNTRYYAFPLAAAGALLAGRSSVPPGHNPARRLFLSMMAAWLLVTVGASIAQIFDLPVAGARLLNYFFAVPLLTGIFLWELARILAARYRTLGVTIGALIAAAAIVGFGFLAWQGETGRKPSISPIAVREVAAAGDYATRFAPSRPLVFLLLKGDFAWRVVQASLPPEVVPRTSRFTGTFAQFEAEASADGQGGGVGSGSGPGRPVAMVVQRYNHAGYEAALRTEGWVRVSPGVAVLSGTVPDSRLGVSPPRGNLGAPSATWIVLALVAVLSVVGGGWSAALLPPDRILRVVLSPGIGAAMITLAALAWDRVGLGFSRESVWALVAATALTGWVAAGWLRPTKPKGNSRVEEPRPAPARLGGAP